MNYKDCNSWVSTSIFTFKWRIYNANYPKPVRSKDIVRCFTIVPFVCIWIKTFNLKIPRSVTCLPLLQDSLARRFGMGIVCCIMYIYSAYSRHSNVCVRGLLEGSTTFSRAILAEFRCQTERIFRLYVCVCVFCYIPCYCARVKYLLKRIHIPLLFLMW